MSILVDTFVSSYSETVLFVAEDIAVKDTGCGEPYAQVRFTRILETLFFLVTEFPLYLSRTVDDR